MEASGSFERRWHNCQLHAHLQTLLTCSATYKISLMKPCPSWYLLQLVHGLRQACYILCR